MIKPFNRVSIVFLILNSCYRQRDSNPQNFLLMRNTVIDDVTGFSIGMRSARWDCVERHWPSLLSEKTVNERTERIHIGDARKTRTFSPDMTNALLCLIKMLDVVSREEIEPSTDGLKTMCLSTELSWQTQCKPSEKHCMTRNCAGSIVGLSFQQVPCKQT